METIVANPNVYEILKVLLQFPDGAGIDEIRLAYDPEINIRTLQRRLRRLSEEGSIIISGNARATIYFDVAYTLHLFKRNYIGINAHYRTNFFKTDNSSNVGAGIYLADPKKPSQISGGIGWQINDVFDNLDKGTTRFNRSTAFFMSALRWAEVDIT